MPNRNKILPLITFALLAFSIGLLVREVLA